MAPTTRLATKRAANEKTMCALAAVMDWAMDKPFERDDVMIHLGSLCSRLQTKCWNLSRSIYFHPSQSRARFEEYARNHPEARDIRGRVDMMTGWHAAILLDSCPMLEYCDGYVGWDAAHVLARRLRSLDVFFEPGVTGPFSDVHGSVTKTLWVNMNGSDFKGLGKALSTLNNIESLRISWSDKDVMLEALVGAIPGTVRTLIIDGSLKADDTTYAHSGPSAPGVKELLVQSGSHGWMNLCTEAAFPSLGRLSIGYMHSGAVEPLPILSSLPNSVRILECDTMPFGFFTEVEVLRLRVDHAINVYKIGNNAPRVKDLTVFQNTNDGTLEWENAVRMNVLELAFPWMERVSWANGVVVLNGNNVQEASLGRRSTGYLMADNQLKKLQISSMAALRVLDKNEHLEELSTTGIPDRLQDLPRLKKIRLCTDTKLSDIDALCSFHGLQPVASVLGAVDTTKYLFEIGISSVVADIRSDGIVFTVCKYENMQEELEIVLKR